MSSTLYRFTKAQGLVHLLDDPSNLEPQSNPQAHTNNLPFNSSLPIPTKDLLHFKHLVCDFDETITSHDTTSCFDTLAGKVRPEEYEEPRLAWSEIVQVYMEDLEKIDDHLHHISASSIMASIGDDNQPGDMDKKHLVNGSHISKEQFKTEIDLPVPKIPSLQPWILSQERKRIVEIPTIERVYKSGNLVGMTKSQLREYGRNRIHLRPGMIDFLRQYVQEQDRLESLGQRRGELWILSINWSQDLIRGALDQIFGNEEASEKYLPDSNLISSNLQFLDENHHEMVQKRRGSRSEEAEVGTGSVTNEDSCHTELFNGNSANQHEVNCSRHLTNGKVQINCITGTDKLHAFRAIQRSYASKHSIQDNADKWAYLGDSITDLGCLVDADLGIIIGESGSLMKECKRSEIQVFDLIVKDNTSTNK